MTYFLSLKSKDTQDTFLQSLIEKREVKRRCKRPVTSDEDASCSDDNLEEAEQHNAEVRNRKKNFGLLCKG